MTKAQTNVVKRVSEKTSNKLEISSILPFRKSVKIDQNPNWTHKDHLTIFLE